MGILDQMRLLAQTQSVICIGRLSGSRRYVMTVERNWPSITKMPAAANTTMLNQGGGIRILIYRSRFCAKAVFG